MAVCYNCGFITRPVRYSNTLRYEVKLSSVFTAINCETTSHSITMQNLYNVRLHSS